ncbi:MAG: ATPase, T2SS/T4P/T4SS family [Nitrospirota bacterium]|nr:ATPase, T2SS/T4P/T4SS family [Nitrospirota bacterium]
MSKYSELFRNVTHDVSSGEVHEIDDASGNDAKEEQFALLFVDDEPGVLKSLRRVFNEENYIIHTVSNGNEALELLDKEKIHLVISDHRMPGMTGAQLLRLIKQRWPEIIRIMLTGYADVQSIMGAVNEGAVYKFITKPWNDEDLRLTVSLALQQYVLIRENMKLRDITKKQEKKLKTYSELLNENRSIIGNILIKSGVVTAEGVTRAAREIQDGELLSECVVRLGIASESHIIRALQDQLNIEYVDLQETEISPEAIKFLPRDLCERNRLIPIRITGKQITLAMADPSDIFKCDNISLMTGLKIVPLIARSSDILFQLDKTYGERKTSDHDDMPQIIDFEPIDEIDIIIEEEQDINVHELIGSSEVPPIIRIVNAIISEAIRYKASDIHIEPKSKFTVIRYRIDGMLHSKIKIPSDLHPATISRIKILAKMDISERRRPQDGRITVKSGTRIVDIRVSTMPTINGEKVVMRILDKSSAIKKIEDLGVSKDSLGRIYTIIKKPQGMIISTGPTGSGKTTLLYSILNEMLDSSKNYQTIEDPVEYFLEDASQVLVKDNIGVSFASILRNTLRQDPDVILVGEIRDYETADVAFKASLTGHMVLTSLHTNNSIASITRLIDMGVKSYLIASAIEGIIAQRLVRKVCKFCKYEDLPDPELVKLLRIPVEMLGDSVVKGRGCEKCNETGYLGRTGIFEIFVMNDDFRQIISSNYKESELMSLAVSSGMKTLLEEGLIKVKTGITTIEELIRVIGPQTRYERKCDSCNQLIDAKFFFCPFCGAYMKGVCKKCSLPLDDEWSVCPSCGTHKVIKDN